MNTERTVEIIEHMASELECAAAKLRRQAKAMSDEGDLTIASEAISTLTNIFSSIRMDLLVTRPIREYERERNARG